MIINFYVFLIGICTGSFANVIIYRFPLNKSIIHPRSFCFVCKNKVQWKDNIPILSWLFLKGKCRYCRSKISIQYPFIEFTNGILFLLIYLNKSSPYFYINPIFYLIFTFFLIVIFIPLFVLDLKFFWLPSSLTNIGLMMSGLFLTIYSLNNLTPNTTEFLLEHIFSGLGAFLIFKTISLIGFYLTNKNILGSGDAKLILIFGLLLGFKGTLITLFLTFNLSGLISIFLIISKSIKRGDLIALGPYIISSGMIVWVFGNDFFLQKYDDILNLLI